MSRNTAEHCNESARFSQKLGAADYNLDRAKEVADRIGGGKRFPAVRVDAGNQDQVAGVALEYDPFLVRMATYGFPYGIRDSWNE
jgi:hypothetical protein